VTGSQSIANRYIDVFNLRTTNHELRTKIVPNWVEYQPATPIKLDKSRKHILFVHHLSPRKGTRELPEIIHQTAKQLPNAHFHIIGNGPDYQWLADQQLPNTTLYGNLPLTTVKQYLASCDLFIMPSRSEGFPRVILEAMTYGLPIVATDVGNVKEIVSKTNHPYISDNNPHVFCDKIIKSLSMSETEREQLITDNNHQAKIYSRSKSIDAFTKLFT
jgi:glycosyltransferase involved in cell wall biosynthesis